MSGGTSEYRTAPSRMPACCAHHMLFIIESGARTILATCVQTSTRRPLNGSNHVSKKPRELHRLVVTSTLQEGLESELDRLREQKQDRECVR